MENLNLIVALRDKVVGNFGSPAVYANEATAKRFFIDLVNDEKTVVHRHPSDFELCRLGYYDEKTGQIYAKFVEDEDIIMRGLEAVVSGGKDA